jgi:AcrR family transcriptional regulator
MEKDFQILQAARELFSQFGLKKVTIDDIAKEARVSKATIYRRYKNKQQIFNDVVNFEVDQLLTAISLAVEQETTVRGKLHAHLTTKLGKLRELAILYRVTRETWRDYWPDGSNAQQRLLAQEKEMVRKVLESGVETGELQVDRPDFTAHLLVIALQSLEYPWAVEPYGVSLMDFVDHMLDILLNGIRKG